jgi:hypothetical protein
MDQRHGGQKGAQEDVLRIGRLHTTHVRYPLLPELISFFHGTQFQGVGPSGDLLIRFFWHFLTGVSTDYYSEPSKSFIYIFTNRQQHQFIPGIAHD